MMQEIMWNLEQTGHGGVYGTADFPDVLYVISGAEADDHSSAEQVVNDHVLQAVRDAGFASEPGWFVHDPALLPLAA